MSDRKIEENTNDYLTLKAVSELAAIPYARVKRDIEHAVLPAYHIGRKYFIKIVIPRRKRPLKKP